MMNKELRHGVMTVRPVANGWIVTASTNDPLRDFAHDIDTFVFNSIEDLCTAFKVFYEEEDDASV